MVKRLILLGLWLACCKAQNYQLASVLSVLTEPSGLPVIEYLLDQDPSEEPSSCANDLRTYASDLSTGVRYARKISTSFGEFPDESVEFTWNAYDYGVIEQCQDVNEGDADDSPFSAQYCMAMTMIDTLEVHVGTCWPSSCKPHEVEIIAAQISLIVENSTDPGLSFSCLAPAPWYGDAIFVLTFFSIVAAVVVVATIYDLYIRKHFVSHESEHDEGTSHPKSMATNDKVNGVVNEKYVATDGENTAQNDGEMEAGELPLKEEGEAAINMTSIQPSNEVQTETIPDDNRKKEGKLGRLDAVLMSFSAATNLRNILSAKPSRSNLGALNGLRVISMFWIILLHCQLFLYGSKKIDNYYNIISTSDKFARMAVNNGTLAVDSFFVLGGLLVTYTTLRKLTKSKGKMNWLMFYFHRYWRLTPALMGTMALWISLGPHLAGQGYLIGIFYGYVRSFCRQYWWTYPLYINNLVPFPGNNNLSCMGWAWYLACDMQFYLISPLIIIVLYRKKFVGIGLILSLTTISVFSMIGISWYYGINPVGADYNDRLDRENPDVTYTKPYTRIHSYLVGMLVGYALYKTAGRKVKLPWWVVMSGWMIAFALGMTCVYGLHAPKNDPEADFAQYKAVLWEGLNKFAFAISIGWVCFACIKGYGGIINSFLSWNFWIPMGRLTYCTYLIHPLVIYNLLISGKALFHFGIISFSFYFTGTVVFCYMSALILTLLMEVPAAGLEKVLFHRS